MEYNDFPILSNEQYKLMQDKFNEELNFDRKETVFSIYLNLCECNLACISLYSKLNKTICDCLKQNKQKLELAVSNLEAVFNLQTSKTEIKDINFFAFLCKLMGILKQINFWQEKEQKEYFKHFAVQLAGGITNVLLNLLSALEKCNIQLFKYL